MAIETIQVIMKIIASEEIGIVGHIKDNTPTLITNVITEIKKVRFSNGKIFMKSKRGNKINRVEISALLENIANPTSPKIPPDAPIKGV